MTKKDYIVLAEALVRARDGGGNTLTVDRVAREMARTFREDNANFNPARWFIAAGL